MILRHFVFYLNCNYVFLLQTIAVPARMKKSEVLTPVHVKVCKNITKEFTREWEED